MDINAIWQIIEPFFWGLLSGSAVGTAVYFIGKKVLKKILSAWLKKHDDDTMAQKVADRLAGKTLNIDVTAVTEKKLDKTEKVLSKGVKDIGEEIAKQRHLLVLMAGAVSKFKAVTEDERAAFTEAIQAIEKGYKPPEPEEVITVSLKPIEIELEGKNEDSEPPEPEESLINFGGIR